MHAQAEAHQSTARERDLLDAAQHAVADAEADLRQAVQVAVNRTRDDYRPAYRDALQGVCQAIDALDAALEQARNVTQAYRKAAPAEPLRRGRSLPPLGLMLPNIDRLLAWRNDHR